METIVRLNDKTAGRDKIARTVQYGSRFLRCELSKTRASVHLLEKLQILENACGSFRKLLRFGRFADSLYAAVAAMRNPDSALRFLLTVGRLANSLFLLADHVVWLGRVGFLKGVDPERWNAIANRYWLTNVIANLARDAYEIARVCEARKSLTRRKDIAADTLRNLCDLWIPLTALGRVRLSPATVGLLGTVSSLVALCEIARPAFKLS